VHPLEPGIKAKVPDDVGVPDAVSVTVCAPVVVKVPVPVNVIPLTELVEMLYVPTVFTIIFKTTVLAEETAVPAVNAPFTKAPVHDEVPPLKLKAAVPLVPPVLAATVTEKVQPLATGVKAYVPAVAGVPLAVSVIFCTPVLAKTPEPLNDIPLIVFVEII
jgi:hypothetical protein